MKIAAIDTIPIGIPFDAVPADVSQDGKTDLRSEPGSPKTGGAEKATAGTGWAGNGWKGATRPSFTTLLIRVTTDDGLVGWGDAFSYNCLTAVRAVVEDMIAPKVIGRSVWDRALIHDDLQRDLHLWGRYGLTIFGLSGLDIALWDLQGKATGQPLYNLLGGARRKAIPGYASLFRYGSEALVANRCEAALSQGYQILKLHEVDPQLLRIAREVAGPDIPITVDTNCPWTVDAAIRNIEEMKPWSPYWVEEPLFPPEDFDGLATIMDKTAVPLAAGENACTAVEFHKMMKAGAVRYAQPSVTKVGGITEFVKVAALAARFGVTIMPHSPYFGPGFIASLHLLASVAPEGWAERFFLDCDASLYGGLVDPDEKGMFHVPDGPGLGIDPDPSVMEAYAL